jgi:pSer/pThr/pTyr-binding forkhead associated (FHA) protein
MFYDEIPYILGRGHESDVRISDISVSRTHARIYLKDKKYYLEDTGSKFGTLVLAKDAVPIDENKKILQVGRTLIAINETKHQNIISNDKKPEIVLTKDTKDYYKDFTLEGEHFQMPDDDDFK